MKLKAPDRITFSHFGFCPGCGHGVAGRLIAEVAEEMGVADKLLTAVDVACGSMHMNDWHFRHRHGGARADARHGHRSQKDAQG
ncbi:MAG: hypothetical protein ACOX4E_03755 [Anaerovoracaceae bacterium]